MPERQPQRVRPWEADRSCIRLRLKRAKPGRACAFVEDRTREGRKLGSSVVIGVLADLFIAHATPTHIRSDR